MKEQEALTERQRTILAFIRDRIESRGYGPTVREIGQQFDIRSPNGVMCHLKALEKKKLIQREGYSARAIQVMDYRPGMELPLLGAVAAGAPIQAPSQDERLNFNDMFGGQNHFALKVRGQSMIEDHIDDGDFVVIRKQETARQGERVVAMIDNEVTLKKFHQDRGRIWLQPSNGAMEPIEVKPESDARILGVLVGVLRKCK
ncbi:MAG: transcriptional repressor LexA [Bacteroidetes bacterium]|nr:transcriptional repressor LexA [Bacteroidota bacterium]